MLGSRGRRTEDESPQINMTPMVDVMLCLLIFFMTATTFYDLNLGQFTVRMPSVSEAAPLTPAPEDLRLTIREPGRVELAGTTVSLDQLVARLVERRTAYPKLGVVIQGASSLSYQDVTDVLDRCEEAQIQKIRLAVVVDPAKASGPGTP